MSGNSFGERFRVTTFGESHGVALGAVVEGCPPGLEISEADLQGELRRVLQAVGVAPPSSSSAAASSEARGAMVKAGFDARLIKEVISGKTTVEALKAAGFSVRELPGARRRDVTLCELCAWSAARALQARFGDHLRPRRVGSRRHDDARTTRARLESDSYSWL